MRVFTQSVVKTPGGFHEPTSASSTYQYQFYPISPLFSCFDFVENQFEGHEALRRIFSLARSFNAKSMILEHIPAIGIIEEENSEIIQLYPDYRMTNLLRLSFWVQTITCPDELQKYSTEKPIGYAILK